MGFTASTSPYIVPSLHMHSKQSEVVDAQVREQHFEVGGKRSCNKCGYAHVLQLSIQLISTIHQSVAKIDYCHLLIRKNVH